MGKGVLLSCRCAFPVGFNVYRDATLNSGRSLFYALRTFTPFLIRGCGLTPAPGTNLFITCKY